MLLSELPWMPWADQHPVEFFWLAGCLAVLAVTAVLAWTEKKR